MAGKSDVPISLIPKTKNSAPPKAPRQIKVSKEAEARIIMLQEEQLTLHERFRMIAEQFAIKLKFDSEPSKVARGQAFYRLEEAEMWVARAISDEINSILQDEGVPDDSPSEG